MNVKVQLDRITVTGKVYDYVSMLAKAREAGWCIHEQENSIYASIEREYSNGDIENKAVMMPNPYQKDSWRIDTSNHLNTDEYESVLKATQLLLGRHLTRIDVAFDFINGPYKPMKHVIIRPRATQTEIRDVTGLTVLYAGAGELQTLYSGKRSSDTMYRLYNKLTESKRHHKEVPKNCQRWERWEVQLRGKKSSDWLKSAQLMLTQVKYPTYEGLKRNDKMALYCIDNRVVSFKDFGFRRAAQLRNLRKQGIGYDDMYAKSAEKALVQNVAEIDKQVKQFLGQLKSK